MNKLKDKISNFYQNHKKGFTTGCVIFATLPVAAFLGVSTYGIVKDKKQREENNNYEEDEELGTDDDKYDGTFHEIVK